MHPIWQLVTNYSGLTATGTINGFPILDVDTADSGGSGFTTAALNPYLIGAGNTLRITVTARKPDATLSCTIQRALEGDMVDTSTAAPIELPTGDPPHVIEQTFDSEAHGFADLLAAAQPTTAEAMTAFALAIRDTLNGGDAAATAALFAPKFEALAAAFGHPLDAMLEQAQGMAAVLTAHRHGFEAADVEARPCCDGRLWELRRRDGRALITIEEDDGVLSLDVCAAQLPTGPVIVR